MILGALLVVVGGAAAAWGARAATSDERPRDLAGAAVAFAGVAVALLGAIAIAVPGFLSLR